MPASPADHRSSPLRRAWLAFREDFRHLAVTPEALQDQSPDFETYCRLRTLVIVRTALVLGVATMLALAPTDFLVYAHDHRVRNLALLTRAVLVVCCLLFQAVGRQLDARRSNGVVIGGSMMLCAAVFGVVGAAPDPASPFVYNVLFVSLITVSFLMRLPMRIFMSTASCLVALAAYYLPHPQHLIYTYNGVVCVFVLASIFMSVMLGHLLFRLERGNFEQRRQIRDQVSRLEELNKLKDSFIATVSHELRTPLNAIIGLTDVVLEEHLAPDVQQYVRTIHGSGETLLSIINDILDIAKIKSGKIEIESTVFSPSELVESVAALFATSSQQKGLELSYLAPPELPLLVGDPVRLNQILLNLVGNAVKFTESGEIQITAEWTAASLVVKVIDTGPGILADKRESVFEEFTQGDASTTRRYGGTGLGLPIVRRLSRMLGGDVTVSDHRPAGSVFTVSVPMRLANPPPVMDPWKARLVRSAVVCCDHTVRRQQLSSLLDWLRLPVTEVHSLDDAEECRQRLEAEGLGPVALVVDWSALTPEGLRRSTLAGRLDGVLLVLDTHALAHESAAYRELGVRTLLARPVRRLQFQEALDQFGTGPKPGPPTPSRPPPDPTKQRPRILVVEDVRENQFLIGAFLSKMSAEPIFADNGLHGVERFRAESFSLVLLDIEMPVMDGYEAVKQMRLWEKEQQRKPTPIVALTAHGSPEHQERTRTAGFTQHLTKPIRKRDFEWLLEQFVHPSEPGVNRKPPSADHLPAVSPEATLLRSSYLARRRKEIVEMRSLLELRDFPKLARIGHNLKGSGTSYGLLDVSALGTEIETVAQQQDEVALTRLLEELRRSVERYG